MSGTLENALNQLAVARNEIKNLRQQLTALKQNHQKDVDNILHKLNSLGKETPENAVTQNSCNCEFSEWRSIGEIKTWFPEKRGIPRQTGICPDAEGVIVLSTSVINNPSFSLSGIEEFSHLWIIFHFHQTESTHTRTKVAPPRLGGERVGVFATRSPHRPCPVGLSLVKLNRVEGNKIYFSGVDMMDGTPILDIKPFIPQYDVPQSQQPTVSSIPFCERLVEGGSEPSPVKASGSATNGGDNTSSLQIGVDPAGDRITNSSSPREEDRQAPDGEEERVQIASWLTNQPSRALTVVYTQRALNELSTLTEHSTLQTTITRLLEQDPRSTYLRRKLGSQFYTFRIESMHVTVKFDDNAGLVTVMFIQPADTISDKGNDAI